MSQQESIADKLLLALQKQYEDIQNHHHHEQQQSNHQGYQMIDMDDEDAQQNVPQNNNNDTPINNIELNKQQDQQYIEIQPTSQDIFKLPQPKQQQAIDEQKIKAITMKMDIKLPEWLLDAKLCENRIKQLFTK